MFACGKQSDFRNADCRHHIVRASVRVVGIIATKTRSHPAAGRRRAASSVQTFALLVAVAGGVGCASIKSPGGAPDGGTGGGTGPGRSDGSTTDRGGPDATGAAGCGNGRVDVSAGEHCDDGNDRGGDGCSADCKTIEKDFSCPVVGQACVYLVRCGDGVVAGNEGCDPPNVGKGCAADCLVEPGYVCDAPPATPTPGTPARCHRTACGDGFREGLEACDDSNLIDGDGCGGICALEPDCSSGTCASKCGDGVKLAPETCDDGNTAGGDGCSPTCEIEKGWSCVDVVPAPSAALNLRVTYRDFVSVPAGTRPRHPDFEIFEGGDVTPLLVKPQLGADGKPVIDGRCTVAGVTANCPYDQQLTGKANFDQWYRDTAGTNMNIAGSLLLPRGVDGSYVYDSGGLGFYPIDNKGWVAAGDENVEIADGTINDGKPHNFGFTTEVRYFFQYRGGETLAFSGDDDVWIFVNRRLALDLGGLHTRTQRALDLDQNAAALGLTTGALYEIVLFHAERHSTGSNFRLTLTGFAPTSSRCRSACGDGVVAAPAEQCDDGNTADGDGCSHTCKYEIVID